MIRSFVIAMVFFLGFRANAVVTCVPASCSPGCDSSCTYKTCSGAASVKLSSDKLPYIYKIAAGEVCQDSLEGVVFTLMPFTIDGMLIKSLPFAAQHAYKICETQVAYGPACPVAP